MPSRVRVYIATSIDGFIAGPADELDWLGDPSPDGELPPGVVGFGAFMAEVGAMVMGRRTYDVVRGMGGDWPYGATPILVRTTRPLDAEAPPTVTPIAGTIEACLDAAAELAAGRDVYVDGGATVRAALDAGRVDDLIVTVAPILLGRGVPLFAGLQRRHPLVIVSHLDYGRNMVQWRFRPA